MRAALYISVCLLLCGCLSPHQSAADSTSVLSWEQGAPAVIRFDNSDTLSPRDISIILHHDSKTAPDSVTLFISAVSPDSICRRDTVTVHIGRNPLSNDIRPTVQTILPATTLPETGTYLFEIAPSEPTRGIWGAGLDFTKTK